MPCSPEFSPLYIECPSTAQADYAAPDFWFEVINTVTFLKILIQPEEYARLREGSPSAIVRGLGKPQYAVKLRETGFIITLQSEDDVRLRYILEEIESVSKGNGTAQQATPIRVIDYVGSDRTAYKLAIAANETPYTIRTGFIEIDPGSGLLKGFGTNGIKFTFRDENLGL